MIRTEDVFPHIQNIRIFDQVPPTLRRIPLVFWEVPKLQMKKGRQGGGKALPLLRFFSYGNEGRGCGARGRVRDPPSERSTQLPPACSPPPPPDRLPMVPPADPHCPPLRTHGWRATRWTSGTSTSTAPSPCGFPSRPRPSPAFHGRYNRHTSMPHICHTTPPHWPDERNTEGGGAPHHLR